MKYGLEDLGGWGCFFLFILVVGLWLAGTWVFMALWNWLLPELFSLPMITFWQSAGIGLFLSMLFGGTSMKRASD